MNFLTFGKEAIGVLGAIAPMIATSLGGPMAGAGVAFLVKRLGLDPGVSQADLEAKITSGDPDLQLKIKQAETDFTEHMKALNVSEEQLAYADRADARQLGETYVRAGRRNYRQDILAYLAIAAFGVSLYELFTMNLPTANRELIVYALGALTVLVKDVYGYDFGTTAGSAQKNDMIAGLVQNQGKP